MVLYIHTPSWEPKAPFAIFVVQTDIPPHVLDRFPDIKHRPIGTLKDVYYYVPDEKGGDGKKVPMPDSFSILSWPVIVEAYHEEVEDEDRWIAADLDVAYQETEHEQRLRIGYGPSPICFGKIVHMEEVTSDLIPPSLPSPRKAQISELPDSELLEQAPESERGADISNEPAERISVLDLMAERASHPGSNHDADVDSGWDDLDAQSDEELPSVAEPQNG